eukprot:292996-Ditylum_brightwellii.AAC.1
MGVGGAGAEGADTLILPCPSTVGIVGMNNSMHIVGSAEGYIVCCEMGLLGLDLIDDVSGPTLYGRQHLGKKGWHFYQMQKKFN